ncbi:MAG: metal ABC transporter permease [Candidatus Paracaedibacteraceae bacterium]|nr:metal ABC transporter permease [Candidatus Paracaedibacteraceae bacterium]
MIDFIHNSLIAPITDFVFMQRALSACLTLSIVCPILGVILLLKRMSLMGEALSHGILPGIAVAFFIWGVWLPGFTIGGMIAGCFIAGLSVFTSQKTRLPQDASFSGFYLLALALGVLLISKAGGAMNVMHLLFGSVLGINLTILRTIIILSVTSLIILRIIFRPLIYQCFDPLFMQSVGCGGNRYTVIFIGLVVVNLVAACQALGTLMALGLMMIPAIAARLLCDSLRCTLIIAILIAIISSYSGLLVSYHAELPTGPTIVLVASIFYIMALISVFFRRRR